MQPKFHMTVQGKFGRAFTIDVHDSMFDIMPKPRNYKPVALILSNKYALWERDMLRGLHAEMHNQFLPGDIPQLHVMDARNDFRVMHDEILPYLDTFGDRYSVVITVGDALALEVNKYRIAHKPTFTHMFVAVSDPIILGIFPDAGIKAPGTIGILRLAPNPQPLVETLSLLREDTISRVIFTVDESNVEKNLERSGLYKDLLAHGYDVQCLPLSAKDSTEDQIAGKLRRGDVLCNDWSFDTFQHTQALIEACNKNTVTMVSGDLTSVKHGSCLGIGAPGFAYGDRAGRMLGVFLHDKTYTVDEMPLVPFLEQDLVRFNARAFEQQGVILNYMKRMFLQACPVSLEQYIF